jgi:hypothetical protein
MDWLSYTAASPVLANFKEALGFYRHTTFYPASWAILTSSIFKLQEILWSASLPLGARVTYNPLPLGVRVPSS